MKKSKLIGIHDLIRRDYDFQKSQISSFSGLKIGIHDLIRRDYDYNKIKF